MECQLRAKQTKRSTEKANANSIMFYLNKISKIYVYIL